METLINKRLLGQFMVLGGGKWLAVLIILLALPFTFAQENGIVLVPLDELTNVSVGPTPKVTPPPIPSRSSVLEQEALTQNCIQTWECREYDPSIAPGQHYYDCRYDPTEKSCRCYTGQLSRCRNEDLRCAYENECLKAPDDLGYYYDCTYDRSSDDCRCFTGNFSRCRLEIANTHKVVPPDVVAPPPIEEKLPVEEEPKEEVELALDSIPQSTLLIIGGGVLAGLILVVVVIWTIRKETPGKHLAAARTLHKKAQEAHERGEEEKAKELMKEAERRRKRAFALKKR